MKRYQDYDDTTSILFDRYQITTSDSIHLLYQHNSPSSSSSVNRSRSPPQATETSAATAATAASSPSISRLPARSAATAGHDLPVPASSSSAPILRRHDSSSATQDVLVDLVGRAGGERRRGISDDELAVSVSDDVTVDDDDDSGSEDSQQHHLSSRPTLLLTLVVGVCLLALNVVVFGIVLCQWRALRQARATRAAKFSQQQSQPTSASVATVLSTDADGQENLYVPFTIDRQPLPERTTSTGSGNAAWKLCDDGDACRKSPTEADCQPLAVLTPRTADVELERLGRHLSTTVIDDDGRIVLEDGSSLV